MQDGGRSGCVLHPGDQPTAQTRDQMIDMLRAGGFAAAAVALVAATTFADPSQASKIDMAPAVNALTEHAAATIDADGFAAGNVNDRAEAGRNGADSSTPADLAAVAGRMVELAGAAVPRPRTLAELVAAYGDADIEDAEQECLAGAVYFEARSEPVDGQLAVAEVVLNRAGSGQYPTTICEVVTQPWQFSFVNATGRIPEADRGSQAWRKAVAISRIALDEAADRVPADVLWYHADYVSPSWGRRLNEFDKIGVHIFYS